MTISVFIALIQNIKNNGHLAFFTALYYYKMKISHVRAGESENECVRLMSPVRFLLKDKKQFSSP